MNSYPTSLDTASKMVSAFMVGLCIFLLILVVSNFMKGNQGAAPALTVSVVSALIWATTLYCYINMPRAITTDPEKITIETKAKPVPIYYNEIRSIRKANDGEMSGVIRTFGNGGCFGYTGLYYNKALGGMRWYCTQRKNYIIIEKNDGKRLITTCDDPNGFLGDAHLKALVAK